MIEISSSSSRLVNPMIPITSFVTTFSIFQQSPVHDPRKISVNMAVRKASRFHRLLTVFEFNEIKENGNIVGKEEISDVCVSRGIFSSVGRGGGGRWLAKRDESASGSKNSREERLKLIRANLN